MNDKLIQIGGKSYKQCEVVMIPTEKAEEDYPTNYENDLNNVKLGLYEGAKRESERIYSEEDLRQAFNAGIKLGEDNACNARIDKNPDFIIWFKQFKKKK